MSSKLTASILSSKYFVLFVFLLKNVESFVYELDILYRQLLYVVQHISECLSSTFVLDFFGACNQRCWHRIRVYNVKCSRQVQFDA